MNEDRVRDSIDEGVGAAQRKVGDLTNDAPLQAEGMAQQVKGNLGNAWGMRRMQGRMPSMKPQCSTTPMFSMRRTLRQTCDRLTGIMPPSPRRSVIWYELQTHAFTLLLRFAR
jgi:uncharacterized protein YjbJ (UPF0337 family)